MLLVDCISIWNGFEHLLEECLSIGDDAGSSLACLHSLEEWLVEMLLEIPPKSLLLLWSERIGDCHEIW